MANPVLMHRQSAKNARESNPEKGGCMSNIRSGGETPLFQNVELKTLEGTKALYNQVVELYAQNVINEKNMRALVYALSNYLPFLKFEKDIELEKRIEALEREATR